MISLQTTGWIQIKERKIRISAVSAIQYKPLTHELRVYEINGYVNVLLVEPNEVTKLEDILAITPSNLVLKLETKLELTQNTNL